MYCENCGKWLNEGEKCDCRKKKRIRTQKRNNKKRTRIMFNGKTLFSIIFLLTGLGVCCYFKYVQDNILDLVQIKVLQEYREYLMFGIPAVIFLIGLIIGILAIRKKQLKILSKISTFANLAGLIVMCIFAGLVGFEHYQILQLISAELTESNCKEIANAYYKADKNASIKMRITDKLTKELDVIGNSFNTGDITYEEASKRFEMIESMDIISDEATDAGQQLEQLKQSKDNFESAEILAQEDTSLLQAVEMYAAVSENDKNYEKAQKRIEEIQQSVTDLVAEGFSEENQEIMLALYMDADEDLKTQIEQKAQEEILSLKDNFKNGSAAYEETVNKLTVFEQIDSLEGEVTEAENYIEDLNESHTAYQNAQELEKNQDTIMDAVVAYQQVTEDDPNYQAAQTKASELISTVSAQSKEEVKKMMEANQYEEALNLLDVCVETDPDDPEFQRLIEESKTKYTEYALQMADQLIGEKKYDEAKAVLSKAYVATESQELQEKLNSVDSYRPVSLTELHVIDGHDYEVCEEMTDSYGNTHMDTMRINGSSGGRAVYQLDGQYGSMTANLVAGEETGSAAIMSFAIFADDEIVYSITGFTRQQGTQMIALDLTDVQKLVIQSSCSGDGWDGKMFLTEAVLEKNINATEPKKEYERLTDNVVIDSNQIVLSDGLLEDSYGNLHDGSIRFDWEDTYVLFNINGKYKDFSGKIVTSHQTSSNMESTIKIYLDDRLLLQFNNINKAMDAIPFSLDVENGKVVRITVESTGAWSDHLLYVVDDKLYFEKTDEIKAAEAATLAGQNGQGFSVQSEAEVTDENQNNPISTDASADLSGKVDTEEGIHRYEVFLQNGTWEDAFNACLARGGHLVRVNTQEEYDYMITQLENLNCRGYRFYIGGRRDLDGQQYFWVDSGNSFMGTDLSSTDAWCTGNWMIGEPSLKDDVINAEEHVMELFYYEGEGRWVWNDVPNNLPDYIGTDAAEKVGYICEYDE